LLLHLWNKVYVDLKFLVFIVYVGLSVNENTEMNKLVQITKVISTIVEVIVKI